MIQVKTKPVPPHKTINSKRFKNLISELLNDRNGHDFNGHYKIINTLSRDLKKIFRDKCGYCETRNNTPGYMERDHYRPKKEVQEDKSHPGYYWLGYEWTNLILACPECNKSKSSQFPIDSSKGKRVNEPPMVNGQLDMNACHVNSIIHKAENSLLLHPVIDFPEKHLIFLKNGEVEGLTRKGKTTIAVCYLNRDTLVIKRNGLIKKLYNEIITVLGHFINKQIRSETFSYKLDEIFSKIKRTSEPHREFSRLGWFLFEEFEIFFISRLRIEIGKKSARLIAQAFTLFKEHGTCKKRNTHPAPSGHPSRLERG